MENKRKTSNPAPPYGGLRGAVVIEVGGKRHHLVRVPHYGKYERPQCERCSLSLRDCDLCCEQFKDDYHYNYWFEEENEDL